MTQQIATGLEAELADGNGAQRPQAGLQCLADERDAERLRFIA